MLWFNRKGLLVVVLLTAGGCKSAATITGTGGAGGSGVDGAVDQASAGGAGGGDAREDARGSGGGSGQGGCLGACLETFFAQCSKVGQSCVSATSGAQINNCYANGVKQAQVQMDGGAIVVVQTSDGHTCYESDLTGTTEAIKDLVGKSVAQITHSSLTQLTIDCYGADGSVSTTHVDLTTSACADFHASMTQTCTAGTCTF